MCGRTTNWFRCSTRPCFIVIGLVVVAGNCQSVNENRSKRKISRLNGLYGLYGRSNDLIWQLVSFLDHRQLDVPIERPESSTVTHHITAFWCLGHVYKKDPYCVKEGCFSRVFLPWSIPCLADRPHILREGRSNHWKVKKEDLTSTNRSYWFFLVQNVI